MIEGIGKRLYDLRTERDLTMDMFVADVNAKYHIEINKSMVSRWEKGQNDPSLENAKCLCDYYNVSLDYLIGVTEVRTPARLLAYTKKMTNIPFLEEQASAPIPTLEEAHGKYLGYAARRTPKPSDKLIARRKKENV